MPSLVFVSMRNSTTTTGEMGSSLYQAAVSVESVDVEMYMCQRSKMLPCSDFFRCCFILVLIRRFQRFHLAGWPNRIRSLQSSLSFASFQSLCFVRFCSLHATDNSPFSKHLISLFIGAFSAIVLFLSCK